MQRRGVILGEIVPTAGAQSDMFDDAKPIKSDRLMKVLDAVNGKMGKGSLKVTNENLSKCRPWEMKQENKSHGYTP